MKIMKSFKQFLQEQDIRDLSRYRPDGSPKGPGWAGSLKNSKGEDVSEYSVGVEIDGQEEDIPTLTPNSTEEDKNEVLQASEEKRFPSDKVINKAVNFAQEQKQRGESFFNEPKESINTPEKRKAQRYESRASMGDIA